MICTVTALDVRPEHGMATDRALHTVFVQAGTVATGSTIRVRAEEQKTAVEIVYFDQEEVHPFAKWEEDDQIPVVFGMPLIRVDQHPQRERIRQYQQYMHGRSPLVRTRQSSQ
jgi:hypothetical protein